MSRYFYTNPWLQQRIDRARELAMANLTDEDRAIFARIKTPLPVTPDPVLSRASTSDSVDFIHGRVITSGPNGPYKQAKRRRKAWKYAAMREASR